MSSAILLQPSVPAFRNDKQTESPLSVQRVSIHAVCLRCCPVWLSMFPRLPCAGLRPQTILFKLPLCDKSIPRIPIISNDKIQYFSMFYKKSLGYPLCIYIYVHYTFFIIKLQFIFPKIIFPVLSFFCILSVYIPFSFAQSQAVSRPRKYRIIFPCVLRLNAKARTQCCVRAYVIYSRSSSYSAPHFS